MLIVIVHNLSLMNGQETLLLKTEFFPITFTKFSEFNDNNFGKKFFEPTTSCIKENYVTTEPAVHR